MIITIFPLVYMIGLSFKPISELLRNPDSFLPSWSDVSSLDTYREVLRPTSEGGQGFLVFLRNSAIVGLVTMAVTVALSILAAYAAARLRFAGAKLVTWVILIVYLFPAVVIAIPLFVLFSRLGMRNSLYGLIIIYVAQTIPVALYMLRSYFQTVPAELEEAGLVDGLGRTGVLFKITIPLAAPAIAAVALYVFMIAWNEFLFALLFLTESRELWTLPLGVQQLDTTEVPKTLLMAGSVIITMPVVLLFFLAERFLTEGLTAGGVKG
ncbi:MAG: carbohydrate ABC transporter permease [bacterium]|nr:carbohydrate ABC transporter permease [bacterium]